jgi:hypothetical protein
VNNYGFEIERQVGNRESGVGSGSNSKSEIRNPKWDRIGFVEGFGNSNSPKEYSYTDKNPMGGSKFVYRLKQIDNDGTFSYSDEVEVIIMPDKFELLQNYPNPFNPVTNIKFTLPKASSAMINVYNIIGQHIETVLNQDLEAGFHNIVFNAENLSSGTYLYKITAGNFSQTKKMLLLK